MPEAARLGLYRAKCDPEVLEIIARARRMRANHPLLDTIYILSNADYNFIEETKKWLASDGWHMIISSNDVTQNWEDQEVGEAVDTEIARRAGVFVGNGVSRLASSCLHQCSYGHSQFSALSSNVALLRTKDGRHRDFTQYW